MAHETSTADIGLFIRDMIEGREFVIHDFSSEELAEIGADEVVSVDASDANNLRLTTDGGAVFVVRIFKEG